MQTLSKRQVGIFCLALILVLFSLAIPLRCVAIAMQVGGITGFAGACMGASLAMTTRTLRPFQIYLWLGAAFLTLAPLYLNFPGADENDVHLWKGAPSIASNYFDVLRMGVFLLAIPYPFALLGHHATDYCEEERVNEEDETTEM